MYRIGHDDGKYRIGSDSSSSTTIPPKMYYEGKLISGAWMMNSQGVLVEVIPYTVPSETGGVYTKIATPAFVGATSTYDTKLDLDAGITLSAFVIVGTIRQPFILDSDTGIVQCLFSEAGTHNFLLRGTLTSGEYLYTHYVWDVNTTE